MRDRHGSGYRLIAAFCGGVKNVPYSEQESFDMAGNDIQVLWVSKVNLAPGLRIIPHSHEYFHFACNLKGTTITSDGKEKPPLTLSCAAPGAIHGGNHYPEDHLNVNFMFLVPNKALYKTVEQFPFKKVPPERAHIPLLCDIVSQVETMNPDPDFVNAAFSYYLRLLFSDNQDLIVKPPVQELADQCKEYIEEHYAEPILLEDIAGHIGKSRNYTSALFSGTYGMTLVDYINKIRIQHACQLIAYTIIPLDEVMLRCGFRTARSFHRVFKQYIGTTPARYRISSKNYLAYDGNLCDLKAYTPKESFFTYAVNARKKVNWDNEYDYVRQFPKLNSEE